ncbi:MAG: F0F1 ATP synthase subunit gamma, partial [Alphaproteobacteria bacterium]|nr:F0F1 ATP synthase subunit gamma [Alphaproteobacteria bacterium]
AEEAASEASTWLLWVEELLARLAGEPVLGASMETLWVVVGPERPICGALPRTLLAQIPPDGVVGLVGTRLAEAAREEPALAARTRFEVAAAATADELGPRAEALAGAILAHGEGRALVLMHPDQGGTVLVRSVLVAGRRPPSERPPESYGSVEEVVEAAVHQAVEGRLAVALAEAFRSEVRARLQATEMARRACERELESLSRDWRQIRQSSITEELMELIAGRRR